jgi:hypothetical protein
MGSGAFRLVSLTRLCSRLAAVGVWKSVAVSVVTVICCNCRQVEHVGEEMRLAEDKLEKLQAMGGPQLVAEQEKVQAEVQAQEAVVEQQVG